MHCSVCGHTSPSGKRFCGDCGAALVSTCPRCSAPRESGKRFCGDCGLSFTDEDPAAIVVPVPAGDIASPVAERRLCTILFCDLVGFTTLSEARDPEEVRELLTRYFDTSRTIINRYGGTVEKFIGDAVMAVWGTPIALEGDAERAVRAALDLVGAVAALGASINAPDLSCRAGVVTGDVAVTIGAVGEGMVAGDSVNTAARIQGAATPGTVYLDESTWRLVRGTVACTEAGEHELKGKSHPTALWRAERVISAVGDDQRIDGLEAALVGRDAELRLVKELFHACVDRRSARLVSIVGPAGIGKTRLGWEFEKYVDGVANAVWWHRGRCLSYGDGVAFYALAVMVRRRMGIGEDETPAAASAKLTSKLDELIADPAIREYVRPRLARLLGVESTIATTLSRDELFAGWRTFFEQLAATEPVVLLIEDVQYADAGLLDFLEHLLDWAGDAPVFVLTLARPEIEDRRPGWGTGRRNATSLTLEALDEKSMDQMLDGLVVDLPAQSRLQIAAHAQGVPLYAMETIRMLVDRDVVQPIGGVYRLVSDVGELSVPETLQSLLAARLDALHGDARRLVADAAVLGGSFPSEAIGAISGLDRLQLESLLTDLVRREVLTVRADPLDPERGQYAFVQPMLRQVAYDTMSRRERKARHLSVADHLGTAFGESGEEVTEVIAQHLLDALHAVPDDDDVPVIRSRAVDTLSRAADRAYRTGAPLVASRSLRQAVDLLLEADPTDADQINAAGLLESAATASREAGDWLAVESLCVQAAALFRGFGQTRDAARVDAERGNAMRRMTRHDEARTTLVHALEELQDIPDSNTVTALEWLATLETFAGNAAEASRLIDRAFEVAQSLAADSTRCANLFITQGITYSMSGRPVQGAASIREAIRLGLELGNNLIAGRALLNLSDAMLMTWDCSASAQAAAQSAALLRRAGSIDYSVSLANQIQAQLFNGQWAATREMIDQETGAPASTEPYFIVAAALVFALQGDAERLDQALPLVRPLRASEDLQDRGVGATPDALAAWVAGDYTEALAHARSALDDGERLGHLGDSMRWCWTIAAECLLALGNLTEVDDMINWLDQLPVGKVHSLLATERVRFEARLAAARNDPSATEKFDQSTAALRALASPWHLANGLADHADYAAATGDAQAARLLATEARAIAEQLGAVPLVRRIDAAHAVVSVNG